MMHYTAIYHGENDHRTTEEFLRQFEFCYDYQEYRHKVIRLVKEFMPQDWLPIVVSILPRIKHGGRVTLDPVGNFRGLTLDVYDKEDKA